MLVIFDIVIPIDLEQHKDDSLKMKTKLSSYDCCVGINIYHESSKKSKYFAISLQLSTICL